MWLLRNESKGLTFRISPGKQNIISRKDGDLLLIGDQSISRKHAEIFVDNENENASITLKDLGSKYGTFVITEGEEPILQVPPNEEVHVRHGDSIRFGIQWNMWRVEFLPLVVTTSTLNTAEKAEVKQMVTQLGGQVVSDWEPGCTHLTMNNITLTVKVVCALACGKPIVMPGYWKSLKESLSAVESTLPKCEDFVPPLAEVVLNASEVSFAPNLKRSILFHEYTFVASSARQLTRIKPMVTAAGGNAVEFSARCPEKFPISEKIIFMKHIPDKQGSQQSQVADGYLPFARKLKAAGMRCVPESEIGLSILYCSTDQNCNPRHSPQALFASTNSESTQPFPTVGSSSSSQDSTNSKQNGDKSSSTYSKKRPLVQSDGEEQYPNKKTNTGGNSEDMFKSYISVKESGSKENPIIAPSLDMFAPSGQTSIVQNKCFGSKAELNNNKNTSKGKAPVVNPSLDMFAPSGQTSAGENKIEVRPSCQDMFASGESGQTQGKKRTIFNEPSVPLNKKTRISRVIEEDDEFSFSSTKRSSGSHVVEKDAGDEFSFVSNKTHIHQINAQDQDDDFSFATSKTSKKRNRQRNPDIFGSSAEPSTSNDKANECQSKIKNTPITSNGVDSENEDLFAFVDGQAPKRRRDDEDVWNVDEPDAEVKIAPITRRDNCNSGVQKTNEPSFIDDPPDEKSLVVYSKEKMCSDKIKEEVEDEDVDELAKELYNATIVMVKPLLAPKLTTTIQAEAAGGGKNFKKFRKVMGINKRIVPHIIGGSDLVPHYASRENIDDVLPPSPIHESPEDDWGFPGEKKKGKNR